MVEELLHAVERMEKEAASELWKQAMAKGIDSWEIHMKLFPLAQRALNPHFINPHLPKMYRIDRKLSAYLLREELPALIKIEVYEFTRRPKLDLIPKKQLPSSRVTFNDIESAVKQGDTEAALLGMASFSKRDGMKEFARRLLLLGSGYLDPSLGHSVSCPAFILLEMMERKDQDPWLALTTLADYFCKGRFHTTPPLRRTASTAPDQIRRHTLRAASGRGIFNLHHTITRYAIEHVRHFFSEDEYRHFLEMWIALMGEKGEETINIDIAKSEPSDDYKSFSEVFFGFEARTVAAYLSGLFASENSRQRLGRFLIKAVCDQYRGNYDPHFLTGLGAALWAIDQYWNQPAIATNALYQYLDYFFTEVKS
jgi:hypothetical protein